MKRCILFLVAATWLLVCAVSPGWAELDPNILWVSDSTVGPLKDIIVEPNGNIIGHDGGTVKEIDATNGKLIRKMQKITSKNLISNFDLSADGRYLACSYDEVVIVDLITNEKKVVARGSRVKFCSESNKIAYCSIDAKGAFGTDSSIVILNLENGNRIYIKTEEMITQISFSADGRFMATGGSYYDGINPNYTSLKLWDAKTFKLLKEFDKIQGNYETYKIEFSPDNKKVGFKFSYDKLYIFNTDTYLKMNVYSENDYNISVCGFTFITNDLIGIQSEKTLIVNLSDNSIINLKEFAFRGPLMSINTNKDILFAGSGTKKYDGSLVAWDLNKVLSSVTNEHKNLQLNTEYKDGVIVLSNLPELNSVQVIKILDIQGKIITTVTDLHNDLTGKLEIKINLPAGIFILQLTDGSKEYSAKFIVTK